MRLTAAALLVLLSVTGCATDAERQAKWAASDTAKCQSYGFTPGTGPFASCRMQLDQHRQQMIVDALDSMSTPRPVSCTTVGAATSCY
jgi:hypothetical protein